MIHCGESPSIYPRCDASLGYGDEMTGGCCLMVEENHDGSPPPPPSSFISSFFSLSMKHEFLRDGLGCMKRKKREGGGLELCVRTPQTRKKGKDEEVAAFSASRRDEAKKRQGQGITNLADFISILKSSMETNRMCLRLHVLLFCTI